jgi:hypothetical protein
VSKSKKPSWLEMHRGPIWVRLLWLAGDLRASKTKSQRRDLAEALDQLSCELMSQEPIDRRGRPGNPDIMRKFALAEALVNRLQMGSSAAIHAVCGKNARTAESVRKLFARQKRGKLLGLRGFSEKEYEQANQLSRQVHRIK